jgi:hypothetical protein
MVGAPIAVGTALGGRTAELLSRALGCGDYVTGGTVMSSENSLMVGPRGVSKSLLAPMSDPVYGSDAGGHFVDVTHREFVTNISNGPVAGAWYNTVIPIQPGLVTSFPFLSGIADNYEQYEILALVAEFRSTTSEYYAGGNMGAVVLACQYNVLSPGFTSKILAENSDYAISARPDKSMLFGFECASPEFREYLITNVSNPGSNQLYHFANLNVGVQSPLTANQILGELWLSYTIRLRLPRLLSNAQLNVTPVIHVNSIFNEVAGGLGGFSSVIVSSAYGTFANNIVVTASGLATLNVQITNCSANDVHMVTFSSNTPTGGSSFNYAVSGLGNYTPYAALINDTTSGLSGPNVGTAGPKVLTQYLSPTAAGTCNFTIVSTVTVSGAVNTNWYTDLVIVNLGQITAPF